jgi:hypothetical protein
MAKYEARLTAALFLGHVVVTSADGGVSLRGPRASRLLGWARGIAPWLIAAAGLAAIAVGNEDGYWAIVAAPACWLGLYLAMWSFSTEQTVFLVPGAQTRADLILGSPWYGSLGRGGMFQQAQDADELMKDGYRTVAFRGPNPSGHGRDVKYVIDAETAYDAEALKALLLGPRLVEQALPADSPRVD